MAVDPKRVASAYLSKEAAILSQPLDRALQGILTKAFVAGQDAGFQASDEDIQAAGKETATAWREVQAAMAKLAPPNWGGPAGGIPRGTLKNLSAALWELAYWAGAFQGPRK